MGVLTQPSIPLEGADKMDDLKGIKEHLDRLTARSWAQESLLLFLAQRAGMDEFGMLEDAMEYTDQMREHLRRSSLSDQQIAHFELEIRGLFERLHRLGEKTGPSFPP